MPQDLSSLLPLLCGVGLALVLVIAVVIVAIAIAILIAIVKVAEKFVTSPDARNLMLLGFQLAVVLIAFVEIIATGGLDPTDIVSLTGTLISLRWLQGEKIRLPT